MRVETIGDATLYLGDCLEILPTLGRGDAVVTDPPYGIGFKYDGNYDDCGKKYEEMMTVLSPYPKAVLQYPEEMMRYLVPIYGVPDEVMAWVYPSNLPRQFRLWGVWGMSVDYSSVKQPAKNPECAKVKNLMVNSYDWWEQPQVKGNGRDKTAHPCQLPTTSVERIIKLVGQKTVIDPFMGSGTTGVACANLGRKFIGIEIDEKYFDIACERIEAAQAQGRLFE